MNNVVTFSGRSVNMDASPVSEVEGMTPERQRELLMASGLGKMVLLSDTAEFAFPPKKKPSGPPSAPPPGATAPATPPAPPPPAQKAPHVAIHVHAPGGSPDGNAPPMGGPPGVDPSAMPPDQEQSEPDKTPQIEAFLQTLPDDITIDDLAEYFETMEPTDDESDDNAPPPNGGPPAFSMTALEMFSAQRGAEFGGPGSGRRPGGGLNADRASALSASASRTSDKALRAAGGGSSKLHTAINGAPTAMHSVLASVAVSNHKQAAREHLAAATKAKAIGNHDAASAHQGAANAHKLAASYIGKLAADPHYKQYG